MGNCSQPITVSLCSSFLTLLPFCSVNPPQAAVLQDKPSAVWAPLCRAAFLQGIFTCSDVGSSTGCREIPVPPRPTQLATGKPAPAPGAPPPTPSAQTLGFAGLLLTHVLPQSSLPVRYFIFFLSVFSQKCHHLRCQDQLCPVWGGPFWTWLDPVMSGMGQPQCFRSPTASPSLPTPSHLHLMQTVH